MEYIVPYNRENEQRMMQILVTQEGGQHVSPPETGITSTYVPCISN